MAIIRMNVHGFVLYDVRESYEEVTGELKDYNTDFVELYRRDNQLPVMINKRNIMDVFPSEGEEEDLKRRLKRRRKAIRV